MFKTTLERARDQDASWPVLLRSRSEVSQAVVLGGRGMVNLIRERGVVVRVVYKHCALRFGQRRRRCFQRKCVALIHDRARVARQSLPLNARRGGWRTSGESVSGMGWDERSVGFTGGNIDWARKG